MASRVTLNHFDLLSHDEQAALAGLLDKPLEEILTDDKNQGWFVRPSPHAFVNPYNLIQPLTLATNLVELCKTTYSVIVLNGKNGSGNSCGHDPDNPRFVMKHHAYFAKQEIDDLGAKRRPQILYDIVERVKAYYYDPDVMPVIQIANSHRRSSDRQRRSESRESLISLLSVMIMNMDLSSLRVGQPMRNGGFFNYSIEWLAEKAKLSVSRAKRAMSDLNNAMLIASYQYRELIDKEKKEYIAHNATRVFDMDFFRMLQIDLQKFGRARKISYQTQIG